MFGDDGEHAGLISIHALHEESDQGLLDTVGWIAISIHALHEESDRRNRRGRDRRIIISIHALHEESDIDVQWP